MELDTRRSVPPPYDHSEQPPTSPLPLETKGRLPPSLGEGSRAASPPTQVIENPAAGPSNPDSKAPPAEVKVAPVVTLPVQVTPVSVVVTAEPGGAMSPLGPHPEARICPSCHAQIYTQIQHKATTKTHVVAALLCFLGGLLCVWIPYVTDSCKSLDHYCPSCQAYLGSYAK